MAQICLLCSAENVNLTGKVLVRNIGEMQNWAPTCHAPVPEEAGQNQLFFLLQRHRSQQARAWGAGIRSKAWIKASFLSLQRRLAPWWTIRA